MNLDRLRRQEEVVGELLHYLVSFLLSGFDLLYRVPYDEFRSREVEVLNFKSQGKERVDTVYQFRSTKGCAFLWKKCCSLRKTRSHLSYHSPVPTKPASLSRSALTFHQRAIKQP
jgi:hypothetical protein